MSFSGLSSIFGASDSNSAIEASVKLSLFGANWNTCFSLRAGDAVVERVALPPKHPVALDGRRRRERHGAGAVADDDLDAEFLQPADLGQSTVGFGTSAFTSSIGRPLMPPCALTYFAPSS